MHMEEPDHAFRQEEIIGSKPMLDKCKDLIPTLRVMVPALSRIISRAALAGEDCSLNDLCRDFNELYEHVSVSLGENDRLIMLRNRIDSHLELAAIGSSKSGFEQEAAESALGFKLPCLRFLSKYDTNNGTTYALLWTSMLNSAAYQIVAATNASEHAKTTTRWFLFEKIGSTLFSCRNPKHFAGGASPLTLEMLMLMARTTSLLVTPLAVVLAEHDCYPSSPYYLQSLDLLRDLIAQEIRPLQSYPHKAEALAAHHDFNYWLTNSKLRGRGGHIFDTRVRIAPAPVNTQDSVECSLAVYDSFCQTKWLEFYRTSFARLEGFVSGLCRN